jgi:hypothetical protein
VQASVIATLTPVLAMGSWVRLSILGRLTHCLRAAEV